MCWLLGERLVSVAIGIVRSNSCCAVQSSLREVPSPTAVPRAMGRRMDAAGLRKTAVGIVIEGIYVVIFALTRSTDLVLCV